MDSKLSYSSLEGKIDFWLPGGLVPVCAGPYDRKKAQRPQVLPNKGIDLQTHPSPAEPKSTGLCRKAILTNNNLERKKEQFNGESLLCQGTTLLLAHGEVCHCPQWGRSLAHSPRVTHRDGNLNGS